MTGDLQQQLATRRAEVKALTERLALARVRLAATTARNREIRARARRRRTGPVVPAPTTANSLGGADGDDPLADARRAAAEMDDHRAALALLATRRADAVRRALAAGLTRSDVARSLGVTRQAVTKLLAGHAVGDR